MANVYLSSGAPPVSFPNREILYADPMWTKLGMEGSRKRHHIEPEDWIRSAKQLRVDDMPVQGPGQEQREVA